MVGQLQGALTFALVCIGLGTVIGFGLGRLTANRQLRDENALLMEQRLAMQQLVNDQSGGSAWILFVLIFMAILVAIWLL